MDAAIYVRISQDRTGAGLGVQRQEEDCRALAERLGWAVVEVYVDNDTSAYSGKPRPAYRRLLASIQDGTAQAVIAWHTDRLHRSPLELEEYVAACERRGVTTQTVQAGELDLATPTGRMVARILGATARQEVEHKAERTRRAQRQAAEAGKWLGGARPFGWTLEPAELHPVESVLVRDACAGVLAGASLGSVATLWNAQGVSSTLGNPWNATTVKQTLLRARNAGLTTWKGEVIGSSTFPAIVSEDTWRGVVAVLKNPSRQRANSVTSVWLLAGIAHCECGEMVRSSMVKNRDGSSRTIYRCKTAGTGHVYINAHDTDAFVTEVVAGVLERQALPTVASGGEDLSVSAAALRARLAQTEADYDADLIDARRYRSKVDKINTELDDIESKIAARASTGAVSAFVGRDGAKRWRAADLATKRTVLRALADVTITRSEPGAPRSFESTRVQVQAAGTRWPAAQR